MNTQEKRCTKCNRIKPITEFYPRSDHAGHRSACIQCEREDYKARREANHEHFRELEKNRDAKYLSSHPERRKETTKRHYEKNRDRYVEYGRQQRKTYPEVNRNSARKWKQEHRAETKVYKSAYRARLRNADGHFTTEQWEQLADQYDHTCLRCGHREPEIQLTPDHVVPLSLGGTNDISNIQPLCFSCNSSKSARNTTDYRQFHEEQ